MNKEISNFIDLEILAKKLEERRTDNPPNSFKVDSVTEDVFSLITANFKFREIPHNERLLIVNKGVFNAAKKGNLTAKSIKGEILKERNLYNNSLTEKKYILATKISVRHFEGLSKIKIFDETINFSRYLPKHFDRTKALEVAKRLYSIDDSKFSDGWTQARVFVKAHSEHGAFLKAIDSLDLLRGIWNLYFNRSVGRRTSSGRRKSINKIVLGQLHTLHKSDGKLATTDFWYEPEFGQQIRRFSVQQDWENLRKFEKYIRKQIAKSNYSYEIVQSILKYTRALDTNNLNNAFLSLWSLLENITVSIASYDDVIRRTLFLFRDKEFHRMKLENLRFYRNQTIHAGDIESENELETLLFQLKQYVEELLRFHISYSHKFRSIEESADFLSLPSGISDLEEKINSKKEEVKLLKKAINFLKS